MKKLSAIWFCCCFLVSLSTAQTSTTDTSEIFQVVDQQALFPGCVNAGPTDLDRRTCSDRSILEFIYQNIEYPQAAAETKTEGTVVVQFVIEKDGSISNWETLKDIGAGCGAEALRVVELMSKLGEKWTPGKRGGQAVRSTSTVPVKFKIKEETPVEYLLMGTDTVWTVTDTPPGFIGGENALMAYLDTNLIYPSEGLPECQIGDIELQLLVTDKGNIELTDLVNYSDLNIDFLYEAVRMIRASGGNWDPAKRGGAAVHSLYQIRFPFLPKTEGCRQRLADRDRANQLMNEGAVLMEEEKMEEGLVKWNEAITLFPNNAEWLALRGQVYLNDSVMDKACEDLTKANNILWRGWFTNLLPVICRAANQ
ncbi:MAG: energy transducer TonB [Bacteroidota bacterium]